MRMARKAADVVAGVVAAEGIEHQVGVETLLQRLVQHARELDAVAVAGGDARDDLVDATGLGERNRFDRVRVVGVVWGGHRSMVARSGRPR